MTTFQIKCFMILANTLSYTKASKILFITQPALSRQIAALENELNVTLFERGPHKVELTPSGWAFSKHCQTMLDTLESATKDALAAEEGKIGRIRFGIQSDSFESTTVDLINSFTNAYPDIEIDIQMMPISSLINALDENRLDVAVAAERFGDDHNNAVLLSKKRECLVVPPDHPYASLDSISMKEFPKDTLIMLSREVSSYAYETIMENLLEADYVPRNIINASNMVGIMMLVACKKGVAILHEGLSALSDRKLRFIPIRDVVPFCRYLMWNTYSSYNNPCVLSLIDYAKGNH